VVFVNSVVRTTNSRLKRGYADGTGHMSEVQQTDEPVGISSLGHHRGDMLLPAGPVGAFGRAQTDDVLKLWKRLAGLTPEGRTASDPWLGLISAQSFCVG
jgi:hypothetical protein